MADFLMPALGADMEKGTLVQWRVQPGARVKPGDVVAVVETQKGAIDVEIFQEGVIEEMVPVGAELLVGEVLARVRQAEGAVAGPPTTAQQPPVPAPAPPVPAPPAPAPPAPTLPEATAASRAAPGARARQAPAGLSITPAPVAHARITPAARRRAEELGVDPTRLRGTGPEGGVTVADVQAAATGQPSIPRGPGAAEPSAGPAAEPAAEPAAVHTFDRAGMRAAISAAMSHSNRDIPHYYLQQAIDFNAAQEWLTRYNADRMPSERLLAAALLLKATALALAEVPQLNGFYQGGTARPTRDINVGWAVALRGGGLIAPAIHHADGKSLPELMEAMRDLVQRARAGGLRSSEMADPTVTITSLGERGADIVQGVVVPPQLALVGFGRIAVRPWVAGGQLVARPVVQASLAADHRATDGHVGSLLLAAIDAALQRPEQL